MRRTVRVGLVVLGAAMAVYGFASLTGGWLGTPPWWIVVGQKITLELHSDGSCVRRVDQATPSHDPRPWDAPIGVALTAAGLVLVAVGTSPWRRGRDAANSPARDAARAVGVVLVLTIAATCGGCIRLRAAPPKNGASGWAQRVRELRERADAERAGQVPPVGTPKGSHAP